MPSHDDSGISGNAILIRAIHPDWVVTEGDGSRLSSASFVTGALEASCFIADEVGGIEGFIRDILPELSSELGMDFRVATLSVAAARARGLCVCRKPHEYKDNPAHVVICASDGMTKSSYKRRARELADDATLL